MQKELTISLSEETYRGLIELVGEKHANQFIESVLKPYFSKYHEEYEVELPVNAGERKIYIHSPHFANPADSLQITAEASKEVEDAKI